ncbi:MAG TPA: sialidase family protein [Candidatus Hydrogenedentes bacterium]|nr:sialidase family protein [Candidatus Hydrogenedentota bacterium]
MRLVYGLISLGVVLLSVSGPSAAAELWLHPQCRQLPTDTLGPFVTLGDGRILAVHDTQALISADEGVTWQSSPIFKEGENVSISTERALCRTRNGAIIVAFMNMREEDWRWNSQTHDADPGTRLPNCVIRSLDDGKTWQDFQKLHDDWTGAVRNMLQTRDGRVVFTSMRLLNRPGRHSVLTYSSTDDGLTWKPSNILDLGGNGHHDGATEATVEELRDGRLWKLIRTNLGVFWQAYSEDGIYWRTMGPTTIPASSAPGLLKRLASGRLMLVWNRPFPEGQTEYPLTGGDCQWSEVPVSNHRGELSVAFSEDDGKTWTAPVVVARQPGASLAYPYVYERTPGVLWLTTMQGGIRVALNEADLLSQ